MQEYQRSCRRPAERREAQLQETTAADNLIGPLHSPQAAEYLPPLSKHFLWAVYQMDVRSFHLSIGETLHRAGDAGCISPRQIRSLSENVSKV